ncbi:MAG: DUF2723 domain-containing protein, partial [Candidatus Promineifilaceae bacterium]
MHSIRKWLASYWPVLVLLLIPALYLLTMARGLVLGDPTEYTFVANILGIAHPPGYAFYTILGKIFQTLIPVGEIPWRMHLTSVFAGTLASLLVYGTVITIAKRSPSVTRRFSQLDKVIALLAALSVAFGVNFWQHANHANPHIFTAAFLSANLYFLTKWWAVQEEAGTSKGSDHWLYGFCLSAGLGVTHHPLTVIGFLAYTIFILIVRPGIWREWRTILKMFGFAALGLLVWLYYPIRSAMEPAFGPHDMNNLDGFLNHVLARGLTESLPFFGLRDAADRALVFWTLSRLQYSLMSLFLAAAGLVWLFWDRQATGLRKPGLLYGLAFISNYLFVINLRQQDIMAYLLGSFLMIGLLTGVGLLAILDTLQSRMKLERIHVVFLFLIIFLLGPVLQLVRNLPLVSIASYREGSDYIEEVFDWFEGGGEGAVLLNDWEHMTPLWYSKYVDDRWPNEEDIRPEFVSTDLPWLQSVYKYLPSGPVYLSGYKKQIVDAGFRLRARGPFYQVVEPGDSTLPPEVNPVDSFTAGDTEITGFQLPQEQVQAGDFVPLTIAMRSPAGTDDYYTPVLFVGNGEEEIVLEFTTDSHLTTPLWEPGEIIVERFDFALPQDMRAGTYPLSIGIRNLSQGEEYGERLSAGELVVKGEGASPSTGSLLANFRQRVGLLSAKARNGLGGRRAAPWSDSIPVEAGDTVHLTLQWQSLAPAEESYTVFVHLINLGSNVCDVSFR